MPILPSVIKNKWNQPLTHYIIKKLMEEYLELTMPEEKENLKVDNLIENKVMEVKTDLEWAVKKWEEITHTEMPWKDKN